MSKLLVPADRPPSAAPRDGNVDYRLGSVGWTDARDLAGDLGAGFRVLRVECPEPVVERSIVERDGVSDADLEIHRQFRDRVEPVEMDQAVVDNSGSEAETRRQVDVVLR